MDIFCNEIIDLLGCALSNDGEVSIFLAWVETWDKEKLGSTGDPIL